MSTYASSHNRYRSTARDAKLWPLVVTAVMVLIAFVPALGLVNLLLFTPVGLILCVNFLRSKSKMWRVVLSFFALVASCVIPLVLNSALMV